MRAANLVVKFLLELAAVASFAVWGWHTGSGAAGAVLVLLFPIAAIAVWGLFCAPRSARRLPTKWRVPLELGIFILAAAALGASGHPLLAIVLTLVVVANALALTAYGQWEL